MPVVFTFDIQSGSEPVNYNHIQSAFERLGWQHLGGTAYRYPNLGAEKEHPVEDWFNHVIPALMLFRAYMVDSGHTLTKYTLDIQSSAGMNPEMDLGTPPLSSTDVKYYIPKNDQFGAKNLRDWLDSIKWPYRQR